MDKQLFQKFLFELERQCRFCLIAYEDLNQALNRMSFNGSSERLWYSIQSFLVASGNISKLLFGLKDRDKQRAELRLKQRVELRRGLGIDDSSPFNNREARNFFEHFDERLETWFDSSTRHNFVDSNVVSLSMIDGIDKHDFIRNFDPEKMAITFYGEECLMIPIIEAVRQLREQLKIEAENERWLLPL